MGSEKLNKFKKQEDLFENKFPWKRNNKGRNYNLLIHKIKGDLRNFISKLIDHRISVLVSVDSNHNDHHHLCMPKIKYNTVTY
jgi:hypothetical protein